MPLKAPGNIRDERPLTPVEYLGITSSVLSPYVIIAMAFLSCNGAENREYRSDLKAMPDSGLDGCNTIRSDFSDILRNPQLFAEKILGPKTWGHGLELSVQLTDIGVDTECREKVLDLLGEISDDWNNLKSEKAPLLVVGDNTYDACDFSKIPEGDECEYFHENVEEGVIAVGVATLEQIRASTSGPNVLAYAAPIVTGPNFDITTAGVVMPIEMLQGFCEGGAVEVNGFHDVLTHEIGHAIGMPHLKSSPVMYPSTRFTNPYVGPTKPSEDPDGEVYNWLYENAVTE